MAANAQVVRWTFVLHNYDIDCDYIAYFSEDRHGMRRVVFGYEESAQGSPHLQVSIS